jgi:hypothetical protein
MIPLLQVGKLRLREAKQLLSGLTPKSSKAELEPILPFITPCDELLGWEEGSRGCSRII